MIINNSDIFNNENIFKKATEIQQNYSADTMNAIPVIFEKSWKDRKKTQEKDIVVNPLFFILLFDIQRELEKKLILDITQLTKKSQVYIQIFLTQYMDFLFFKVYGEDTSEYVAATSEDTTEREKHYLVFAGNEEICLFTSHEIPENEKVIFDFGRKYSYLPIFQLRRQNERITHSSTKAKNDPSLSKLENRLMHYGELSIDNDLTEEKYRNNLENFLLSSFKSLGFGENNIAIPLSGIIFELLDNIRRHTRKEIDNAHICFYHDKDKDRFELLISDNYSHGFLREYKCVLKKEKKRLKKAKIPIDELKDFTNDIKDINEGHDEKVIGKLFGIDESMSAHQIPRIAMHFGIPILLKLLKKLQVKSRKKVSLDIYLHSREEYHHLSYKFNKSRKEELSFDKEYKGKKKGTYILISIPDDIKIENNGNNRNSEEIKLNIKNNDYKKILDMKHYEFIKKSIDKFRYLPIVVGTNGQKYLKNLETKKIIVDYSKLEKVDKFSDFIRRIYLYAYENEIQDIVVVNVPIEKNKIHLDILAEIIFGSDKKYTKVRNILFYNKYFPSAIFVGGTSKKEFMAINNSLGNYYFGVGKNKMSVEKSTDLLYKIDKDNSILLPFELFKLITYDSKGDTKEEYVDILEDMIKNYLERTKIKDIHIDTQRGYHINGYYKFNKIFENSQWVQRIAFRLAILLKDKEANFSIVGTDKYTSMVISLVKFHLEEKNIRYAILNGLSESSIGSAKELINKRTIFYSSVLFEGNRTKELFKNEKIEKLVGGMKISLSKNNWFNAIHLKTSTNKQPFKSLFSQELEDIYRHKQDDNKYCTECKSISIKRSKPLYSLSKNDSFAIKDFYENNYIPKGATSYTKENNILPRWFNSVYFVHAARGSNHYSYYTKTIPFFRDNKQKIIKYLMDVKDKRLKDKKLKNKIILFAPLHNTNNNFVSLVNKIVFDNNATVWNFDKNKGEVNYHAWGLEDMELKNYSIFFVDDEISSGHTLEYFYSLLRSIPNVMIEGNIGFDGIFVMIDRMSIFDEGIVCNYIRDDLFGSKIDSEFSQNRKDQKMKLFFVFTTLEVKPIKTEIEKCYLCKRQKEYNRLFDSTSLDMTRFQIAPKIIKLNKTEANNIDYDSSNIFKNNIKNTIKMLAVDYLYSNFEKFDLRVNKEFEEWDIVTDFWNLIRDNLIDEFYLLKIKSWSIDSSQLLIDVNQQRNIVLNWLNGKELRFIGSILRYEAKVALIKAMSFPKVSYYKKIRDTIVGVLFYEMNIQKNSFGAEYKIIYSFDNNTLDGIQKKINSEAGDYLKKYKYKTNLNYFNFLLITCGHLKEDVILDENYIQFYHELIVHNQGIKEKLPELFHSYPFAVKMVTDNDKEKTDLFLNNLIELKSKIEDKTSKSLMDALYIEANAILKPDKNIINDIITDTDDKIDEKFKNLKTYLLEDILLDENSKDIELSHLYIAKNFNGNYKNYKSYLDTTSKELIDLFNNFQKIDATNVLDKQIVEMYYGKLSNEAYEGKLIYEKIHNTWANSYTDDKYTIIRLVMIDKKLLKENIDLNDEPSPKQNNPIWFKPVGCIVLKHKEENEEPNHIQVSKKILAVHDLIVDFICRLTDTTMLEEAIKKVEYDAMHKSFIHNEGSMLEMAPLIGYIEKGCSVFKKDEIHSYLKVFKQYAHGVTKIGRIGRLKLEDYSTTKDTDIFNLIDNEKDRIYGFIEMTYNRGLLNSKIDINLNNNVKGFLIPINYATLSTMIYELFYNAAKYGMGNPVMVEVYISNSILYIKNKNKASSRKGFGIAIDNITEVFSKVKYKFDAKPIRENYIITIKKDK